MIYKTDNLKGIVQDVGLGKHPSGTFNILENFDCEREVGSIVSRSGFSAGISAPNNIGVGGLVTAKWFLNSAVNYPSSLDQYLLFYETASTRGTFLYPYFHNNSTPINDWIETKDYILGTLSVSVGNVALFLNMGNSPYAMSEVANYYKNWVMIDSSGNKYFVKGYSFTFNEIEEYRFTLDRTPPANGVSCMFVRYFHDQLSSYFTTYYNSANLNPSCYSSDLAVRWSEGESSDTQHKNKWAGYLSKTFFNTDNTNKYTFTGTYVTEAECKAPTISDLGTPVLSAVNLFTSQIPNQVDKTFSTTNAPNDYHWVGGGSTTLQKETITYYSESKPTVKGGDPDTILIPHPHDCLAVKFESTGQVNAVELSSAYFTALGGLNYKLNLGYINPSQSNIKLTFHFLLNTNQLIAKTITLRPHSNGSVEVDNIALSFQGIVGINNIHFYSDTAETIYIKYIDIVQDYTNNTIKSVQENKTYTLFASYVYDGFQESEFIKVSECYLSSPNQKLVYTLKQDFAKLNKRVTSIRTYIDVAKDNTTLNLNKSYTKYLLSDIHLSDELVSNGTWSLNSTTNTFNFTDEVDGNKVNSSFQSLTWEQKTNRVATSSTSCSYSIAKFCSGRIFLANEYDYSENKSYNQRVRYAGYSGDGVMCPDIFPNITDRNITYITSGNGVKINALEEFNGSLLIVKEGSILELTTSDFVELWRLKVLDNNFASLGKNSILSSSRNIYFCGVDGISSWGGGDLKEITSGVWRNLYQSIVSSITNIDRFYIIKKKSKENFEIFPNTASLYGENISYEINELTGFLRKNTYTYSFIGISLTKDNKTYAMTSSGNIFYINNFSALNHTYPIYPTFKTNKIIGDAKSNIVLLEIFLTIEGSGTINGSATFDFKGNNLLIQSYTIVGSVLTNNIKYYKFKVRPHKPIKYIELELTMGLYASNVGGLKIHEFGFEFEAVKDAGDVLYT